MNESRAITTSLVEPLNLKNENQALPVSGTIVPGKLVENEYVSPTTAPAATNVLFKPFELSHDKPK